jgi:hypothetical protein
MRTTRPTSTSLQDDALISASPISIDSEEPLSARGIQPVDETMETYWALSSRICRLLVEIAESWIQNSVRCCSVTREALKFLAALGTNALA